MNELFLALKCVCCCISSLNAILQIAFYCSLSKYRHFLLVKVRVMHIKAAGKGFSLVYFRLLPPGGEFNDTVANNSEPSISEAAQQLLNQERKHYLRTNSHRMNVAHFFS